MSKRIWVWIMVLMTFISTDVPAQVPESTPKRPTLKRRTEGDAQQSNLDQRVADLSEQISTEMTENRKRTIAVVEFVDLKGSVTDFGRYLSEELITRLFQTKKFTVIERQMLNKVIAEQKLTLTGTFDQSSARQLGRLLGVDAICSGTVGDLGQRLKVNARLISTETGAIFAVASTEILKDESVTRLMAGVTVSSNRPTDTPNTRGRNAAQTVEAHFFAFELQQCAISGTTIICDLLVTNRDKDRTVGFGDRSRVFDNFGNESQARRVRVANKEDYIVFSTFVSSVPTRLRLTFEEISPQASSLALLDILCALQEGEFNVQFRNVPLTR